MTSKRKRYKTYTKEFKQEAIRMMASGEKPAAELAMELGIRRNQLYKWKEQLQGKAEQAFSGPRGRPKKENQGESTQVGLTQEAQRLTAPYSHPRHPPRAPQSRVASPRRI